MDRKTDAGKGKKVRQTEAEGRTGRDSIKYKIAHVKPRLFKPKSQKSVVAAICRHVFRSGSINSALKRAKTAITP